MILVRFCTAEHVLYRSRIGDDGTVGDDRAVHVGAEGDMFTTPCKYSVMRSWKLFAAYRIHVDLRRQASALCMGPVG